MLVYARTPSPGLERSSNNLTIPVASPPPHALNFVHAISSAHSKASKIYTEKYYIHSIPLVIF